MAASKLRPTALGRAIRRLMANRRGKDRPLRWTHYTLLFNGARLGCASALDNQVQSLLRWKCLKLINSIYGSFCPYIGQILDKKSGKSGNLLI